MEEEAVVAETAAAEEEDEATAKAALGLITVLLLEVLVLSGPGVASAVAA